MGEASDNEGRAPLDCQAGRRHSVLLLSDVLGQLPRPHEPEQCLREWHEGGPELHGQGTEHHQH